MNSKEEIEALGKLRISRELTEGANADAFKATDINLGRECFVKLLYSDGKDTASAFQEPRFVVDATSDSIDHKNIVQVYDAYPISLSDGEYVLIEMEWIEGRSLYGELHDRRLSQHEAVCITSQILNGLHSLHSKQLIHRDLKPSNILISTDGKIKISDFGSMALLKEVDTHVSASQHSVLYVPPEGWRNKYSKISDLYQVGLVLHELVSGPMEVDENHYRVKIVEKNMLPAGVSYFAANRFLQNDIVNQSINQLAQRKQLLPHGRSFAPYLSPSLKRIILKATKPLETDRYDSCESFERELNRLTIPNWKEISQEEWIAENWQNYDWKIYLNQRPRSADEFVIERKRKKFRNFNGNKFLKLREAFSFVEKFKS